MHFQDVKEVDGKEVYEMSPDAIVFDPSLPAKTQAKVKADICAARPLKRARKPVTDEADRRKACAVRRRRRDMVKSQEKVEKATIRASGRSIIPFVNIIAREPVPTIATRPGAVEAFEEVILRSGDSRNVYRRVQDSDSDLSC